MVIPLQSGGGGECAEEVCRRKVDAAENRDTRREEEALVTAVAVTYSCIQRLLHREI